MVLDKLRGKKKPKAPAVPRSEFLKIKPVRNPSVKWEKKEKGEVRIIITLGQPKKKGLLSKFVFSPPKEKKIDLDKVGSVVWELCDGEKTVGDIAQYLQEKYKFMLTEAEISLNAYFQQLSKRGLVGFILPEETRARFEEFTGTEKGKKQR